MSEPVQRMAVALEALLPPALTPEQRARHAAIAALVQGVVDRVPHARDEFTEPASVFVSQKPAQAAR